MLEAFLQEGVVPVIKHFPGHGDTGQDSHSELAVIDRPKQSVEDLELKPFKDCAELAPALLAGHVWLTAYEEKPLPATLSAKLLEGVLRKRIELRRHNFHRRHDDESDHQQIWLVRIRTVSH